MWLLMAVLSAFFAGLTSILAKCGIKHTDSDVATAIRTIVVLIFSAVIVIINGSYRYITAIDGKALLFLVLSGIATGVSWICYFKALSMGDINKVVPIDKSSTVLSVLLAILFFHETDHLPIKLIGIVLLSGGILLMTEKKPNGKKEADDPSGKWLIYAVLSAVFAALTSILAKVGISDIDSNLGTAIRTFVVLIMAWLIVISKRKFKQVKGISRQELFFLILSGIATGISWLCYYYAIQNGIVSVVVPIDKMSIVVSVIFSYIVFRETLSKKGIAGLLLMTAGTVLMAVSTN